MSVGVDNTQYDNRELTGMGSGYIPSVRDSTGSIQNPPQIPERPVYIEGSKKNDLAQTITIVVGILSIIAMMGGFFWWIVTEVVKPLTTVETKVESIREDLNDDVLRIDTSLERLQRLTDDIQLELVRGSSTSGITKD